MPVSLLRKAAHQAWTVLFQLLRALLVGYSPVLARGSMTGRVAVVTGANSGIGLEVARGLMRAGARVVLACRDVDSGRRALASIREDLASEQLTAGQAEVGDGEVRYVDLGKLETVRDFVRELDGPVDVLVNNAGILIGEYERTMMVNFFAPYLLTRLLLPRLLASPDGRVVNVSSLSHYYSTLTASNVDERRVGGGWPAYYDSKLAGVLLTYRLQREAVGGVGLGSDGLRVYAVDPGIVHTRITKTLPPLVDYVYDKTMFLLLRPAREGAAGVLRAAGAPDIGPGGKYLKDGKIDRSSARSHDVQLAERMHEIAMQRIGLGDEIEATRIHASDPRSPDVRATYPPAPRHRTRTTVEE